MPGRFPLLTDENVPGPVIEGLRASGWDVVLVVDVFGQQSVDDVIFGYAAERQYVLVTTDADCLVIARRWLEAARPFRLVYWHQGRHRDVPVRDFVAAFEQLATSAAAFAACVEYLKVGFSRST